VEIHDLQRGMPVFAGMTAHLLVLLLGMQLFHFDDN
jgi:hypothetical protein